jgi:hypothetical protein
MSAKRYPGYDTASGFPLKQQNALNFEQQIESRGREKKVMTHSRHHQWEHRLKRSPSGEAPLFSDSAYRTALR